MDTPTDQWSSRENSPPRYIGRYRVEALLGRGGFGTVYRARDSQLDRSVAIKVPHAERVAGPGDIESYLAEARLVASLDHSGIVPVYDVGQTEDGRCYVVSKFIKGSNLWERMRASPPSHRESAQLVAAVAEALHCAHLHGIVHCDVKPGNILLDLAGRPYVADFGVALKQEDLEEDLGLAGTPEYMSPEQARGEGHRLDGRSDIFSLGIVLYELLTGRRPFGGKNRPEFRRQLTRVDPRPPRQSDDRIPKELERICLKALSKRMSNRYTTALDFAEDLRGYLAGDAGGAEADSLLAETATHNPPSFRSEIPPFSRESGVSGPRPPRVVPKGLRSFDEQDADFFVDLLPGPRDRDGLPDSIRFWKSRIEEEDPDKTFAVGLIYGPSGCGKSSFVKAGLLPRLAGHVLPVYVEATAKQTEARLLKELKKLCPGLPEDRGLRGSMAAVRRQQEALGARKILIVLDQFEQWLHANVEPRDVELIEALRQCDGGGVQCVVMVRDDFWMAVTQFFQALEILLVEQKNSAAVDLFDTRHAGRVLTAFGRAFEALPESPEEVTKDQGSFLGQAVAGLAQDGKVICVRLALFAEMMKGKPWTPAALRAVGGTEGVGVKFLEETFSAPTAPPKHRFHQKAARYVLKTLLPEPGEKIRGSIRSYPELLEASGYSRRPESFDELLQILDAELRLVTPSDPEEVHAEGGPSEPAAAQDRCYQLTHDYLVPSLREWLTGKQKETRRGRAELRLAERAAVWNAKPENRHLPSLWEWVNVRLLTRKKDWSPPQRNMLRKADRYHVVRALIAAVLVILVGWGAFEGYGRVKADRLVQALMGADADEIPSKIQAILEYSRWAKPLLVDTVRTADDDSKEKLCASLALLPVDPSHLDYLYEQMFRVEPEWFLVVREALLDHRATLAERVTAVLENQPPDHPRDFRAACALAQYDPDHPIWEKVSEGVAGHLVSVSLRSLDWWIEALRPVRERLLPSLCRIFRDPRRRRTERFLAARVLAEYARDRPRLLVDLVGGSDTEQFGELFAKLRDQKDLAVPLLRLELDGAQGDHQRRANVAAALARLGHPEDAWPVLKHTPFPDARSYLIHRLGPLGADCGAILTQLEVEADASIRRALILAVGQFDEDALSAVERKAWTGKLLEMYRNDPDPGIHGAAAWLLRRWKEEDGLKAIERDLATGEFEGDRRWCVSPNGHTMVLVPPCPAGAESSPDELERDPEGRLPQECLGRSVAIASKETTVAQFQEFLRQNPNLTSHPLQPAGPGDDLPQGFVSWYDAAAYCNWLSAKQEIPESQWCYERNESGRYVQGMTVAEDYLKRSGYRLPTATEWRIACSAGAATDRYYGQPEALLGQYAWHLVDSEDQAHPVGSLKPNDLGLFDMHGNVWEWCQDTSVSYQPQNSGGVQGQVNNAQSEVRDAGQRVIRGGSFRDHPERLRSATFVGSEPANRGPNIGFRVARCVP